MSASIGSRPLDLAAVLESQTPVIDLHLKEFENSSKRFLKAVSAYSARALEEIAQRRARHAAELKRTAEKSAQLESEIQACKIKEIELMKVLEKEQLERREAEAVVGELRRQFTLVKEKCASVDVEIEQYTAEVNSLRRDKQKDMNVLDTHAARVSPELHDLEVRLQFVIEGIGEDKLLMRFLQIDPSDPHREFSIVIDASERTYKVPFTTPPIPTIPLLVDHLNKNRDLFQFIKAVRAKFVEMTRNQL